MKKIIFLFIISFFFTSCFDEATFKLNDGKVITVDQSSLKEYKVGQKVWLARGYGMVSSTDWEILTDFDIGEIGFYPKKDTSFIFASAGGDYVRQISLGTLVKKN